ncbi:DUF3575 domain-containing protein [Myroides pelagicus]|uniref:DUF3575 domain-containing protein n=1 Tax=Myroides pelagicus TaxID=270914 RepID=A0A7K1GKG6_9FLAO|nr:DUF3575 domain-containing protein [Myroides pelagicus]MEC4113215.1 DUF3575 domain-containing protein [Myroides pelagicus]MTH29382.1 DUF3575 domain-containing protein [Myroides pelagicus]
MKRVLLGLLFLAGSFGAKAQAVNEVKVNVLNTLVLASVELGYEHFIDHNQSIGANFNINDRFSYHAEKKSRNQKFKTNSLAVNYNYYFGGKDDANGSGYVLTPFMKYRFGDFEETKWNDVNNEAYMDKVDMNSFIFGMGFGYKWALGDSFTINPFANIARNFSSEVNDRFSAIEFNAGVNIGYRF